LALDGWLQVLLQTQAVDDLPRLGRTPTRGLGVEARSVVAHDLDLGMSVEPILRARCGSDRLHVGEGSTLKIDDDRAVGLALVRAPLINACDAQGNWGFVASLSFFSLCFGVQF
jgi:hypothetical protein